MTSVMTKSQLKCWHNKLHIAGYMGSFTNHLNIGGDENVLGSGNIEGRRHKYRICSQPGIVKDRADKWRW